MSGPEDDDREVTSKAAAEARPVTTIRVTTDSEGRIRSASTLTLANLPGPPLPPASPDDIVTEEQIVAALHRIGWDVEFTTATRTSELIEAAAWHLDGDDARARRASHETWLAVSGKVHGVVWACGVPLPNDLIRLWPDWTTNDPRELLTDARQEADRRHADPQAADSPLLVILDNTFITTDLREDLAYLNDHPDALLIVVEEQ